MPINFVIAHTLYRLLTTKACFKLTDKDLPFVRPDRILHNGSKHGTQCRYIHWDVYISVVRIHIPLYILIKVPWVLNIST